MSLETSLVVYSIAAPAAVALAVALLLRRHLPENVAGRLALPVAVAAGYFACCWLVGEWSLLPQRPRQWLPYLGCAAAFLGQRGKPSWVNWIAWTVLAAIGAWLLVPTWDSLWPPRPVMVPLLATYWLLVMGLLANLPDRLTGTLFTKLLAAAALASALLILIGVSIKIGQFSLAAAAALAGSAASLLLWRSRRATADQALLSERALVPIFAILVGGLAFSGTIDPPAGPLPIILLAPAAPLALWLFAAGPLAKLQGWRAIVLQASAVLLPLAIALAWLLLT
jgi:hypothetical protein